MCRALRVMALRLKLVSALRRAARITLRVLAWIPVLIVALVLIWGYYVYVYVMNISGTFPKGSPVVSILVSAFVLVVAHVLLALQLVSYIRTIYCKHREVPPEFCLTEDQLERLDRTVDDQDTLRELSVHLRVVQRNKCGGIRYCDSCELIKPDRCHHCSICNRCILKMDHHCPWVNNCVGYSNYKYFVLFLLYTALLCAWFAATGFYDFIRAWNKTLDIATADKFNVIFCFFVCSLFGMSTGSLLSFHVYLSLFNRTTLENMQWPRTVDGSDRRLYYVGFKTNLKQVFGSNCLLAFLPLASMECNGVHYPTQNRSVELGQLTSHRTDGDGTEEEEGVLDSEEKPLTSSQPT